MRRCIITLLAVISSSLGYSQSPKEIMLLREQTQTEQTPGKAKFSETDGSIASILFVFYKSFLSSQDHQSCVFIPSCSEYALQSLRKQGLVAGTLDTFDRITRCHGLRSQDYQVDPRSKLFIDPVRNIRYEKP